MFYSEKFRNEIYWQYGLPCTYSVYNKLTGSGVACAECKSVDFIRIPLEYSMQCVSCWNIMPNLANPYKFITKRSYKEIKYPEFPLFYTGILKAVADYKKYDGEGYIRIFQYDNVVDFIPLCKKENNMRCAHVETELIDVEPTTIKTLVKEAWDWERGEEIGMKRSLYDFLSSNDLHVFKFQGPKRRNQ